MEENEQHDEQQALEVFSLDGADYGVLELMDGMRAPALTLRYSSMSEEELETKSIRFALYSHEIAALAQMSIAAHRFAETEPEVIRWHESLGMRRCAHGFMAMPGSHEEPEDDDVSVEDVRKNMRVQATDDLKETFKAALKMHDEVDEAAIDYAIATMLDRLNNTHVVIEKSKVIGLPIVD